MTPKTVPTEPTPAARSPPMRFRISSVSLPSSRAGMLSTANTRADVTPTIAVVPSEVMLMVMAGRATALRLAAWPLAYLTYASPIRFVNPITGKPFEFEATAMMYPLTPGSRSDIWKLAVWFFVRQRKELATLQSDPLRKNRWTEMLVSWLLLVMLTRVSVVAGFDVSEVYAL